jgi:cytochrome c-type biogenesis protein CcmH/NrfG
MDPLDEIRALYFRTTAATIERDFARAIDLLKAMADDTERGRAHVFMEGLAEMRKEWQRAGGRTGRPRAKKRT